MSFFEFFFPSKRNNLNKKEEKKKKRGTHRVLCHACSTTARRLPLIALSLFDRVGGGGPPASRFLAGLMSAMRSPSGVAFFGGCALVFSAPSTSTSTTPSGFPLNGDGEEEEEVEGAPSSSSSSSSRVARGWELRGRNCRPLAGTRGRKREEEEEEEERAAAAAGGGEGGRRRRRRRSRPPSTPTPTAAAAADDGGARIALTATPSLLPRPEQPGAEATATGSLQQAARIAAEQTRRGDESARFPFRMDERRGDFLNLLASFDTKGRKKKRRVCGTNQDGSERKETRKLLRRSLSSLPFFSSLCEMSATRAMAVSRTGCVKLIAALSRWEREGKRTHSSSESSLSFSLLVWRLEPLCLSPRPPFSRPSSLSRPLSIAMHSLSQQDRLCRRCGVEASAPRPARTRADCCRACIGLSPKRPGIVVADEQ